MNSEKMKYSSSERDEVVQEDIHREIGKKVLDIEQESGADDEYAPEGYLTIDDLAKTTGVNWRTVKNRIEALNNEESSKDKEVLGKEYKFKNGRTYVFYSPEEQRQIIDSLDNVMNTEQAPEGYLTANGLAKELGVASRTVKNVISSIGDTDNTDIQSVVGSEYKTKLGHVAVFYSPKEQQFIRRRLEKEQAPKGYLTAYGLAERVGVNGQTIKRRIDKLNSNNGSSAPLIVGEIYRLKNGKEAAFYSPEEQQMIIDSLDDFMTTEQAPEGYLTADALSKDLGVSYSAIINRINSINSESDDTSLGRKFKDKKGNVGIFYSSEEQKQIEGLLGDIIVAEQAPEGYLTVAGLANKIGIAIQTVQKKIDELSGNLDGAQVTGGVYKTEIGHVATFYSLEEQSIIIEALEQIASGTSFPENAAAFYLIKAGHNIKQGSRPEWLKNPETGRRLELDIFVDPPGVGIEYDGWRYHQDVERDVRKDQVAKEHGCRILHIRENGCPDLPSDSICIRRNDNKKNDDLSECIKKCFDMLGISAPDINVARDRKEVMAFMRQRVLDKLGSARTFEELSVAF